MNKSNKRQLEIIDILKHDKFVKVWQLSEFTLVELVGYEDVEARSHESLASLVVHKWLKDTIFTISFDKTKHYDIMNPRRGFRYIHPFSIGFR